MADHAGGNHDKILAAIEGAANELHNVENELGQLQAHAQKLQQRATQLQEFIGLGKILLGEKSPDQLIGNPKEREISSPPTIHGPLPRKLSAVDYAKQVLEEVGRPMRAMEMAEYLQARGLMRGKWTREVLRTAMRKNQHIFARIAEGVYALQAWSSEQKSIPEEGMQSLFSETKQEGSEESPTDGEAAHSNTNMDQPLKMRIIEMLEFSTSSMSPLEMRQEFAHMGTHVTKERICSALSKLTKEGRIKRPEPGRYASITFQAQYLVNNGLESASG